MIKKRILLIITCCVFLMFLILFWFKDVLILLKNQIWYKYAMLNSSCIEITLIFPEAEEIKFDKDYALNISIILYKQLYGKDYLKSDFLIDDTEWFVPCWNVRLKDKKNSFQSTGIIDDRKRGVLISKKNGGILVNFGE